MRADASFNPAVAADWRRSHAVVGVLLVICIGLLFRRAAEDLVSAWLTSPEYNYGPIVPVLAAIMIWRDLQRWVTSADKGTWERGWTGLVLAAFGFVAGLVGYLHQTQFIGQLGLFLTVIGSLIAILGERQARAAWPGLLFLLFALPLATVVQFDLTWAMQLIATEGGVALIRLFDVPVFREGNIIDLGQFQLQVAEACSGLRYLFPLACFSYLCAYLFRASSTMRCLVLISALPITMMMNIVRIAITGLLVNWIGLEAAQGFFHDFEGWVVFCLCLLVLFLEMKLICVVDGRGRSLLNRLDLTMPNLALPAGLGRGKPVAVTAVVGLSILALATAAALSARESVILVRAPFADFPVQVADWRSSEEPLDEVAIRVLNATDYLSRNYSRRDAAPVNVFVSFYESERTGTAIHSPQVCIPGAGWEIEQISEIASPYSGMNRLLPDKIKRLIIRRGGQRQLVYYWFVIGGEPMLNEYAAKFQAFTNTVTKNRSDEGLVRFVTPISPSTGLSAADQRLLEFLQVVVPTIDNYFPAVSG